MISDSDKRQHKRQQALERLRQGRTGAVKRPMQLNDIVQVTDQTSLADFVGFSDDVSGLSSSIIDQLEELGAEAQKQSQDLQFNQLQDQLKKVRKAHKDARQEYDIETVQPSENPQEKRKELFREVLSNHFRDNIKEWLLVNPNLEISSTSIEELEEYRQDVLYRQKLLKVILDATQHELSRLEQSIQSLKSQS